MNKPSALLPIFVLCTLLTIPATAGAQNRFSGSPAPVSVCYEIVDARHTPHQRKLMRQVRPLTVRERTHRAMNTLRWWLRP